MVYMFDTLMKTDRLVNILTNDLVQPQSSGSSSAVRSSMEPGSKCC